ncbi:MAG: radical SAM protein, partial [Clostridium sulfidigenes]|nr:radical SAM protein [Clostridium sulfidigenes]
MKSFIKDLEIRILSGEYINFQEAMALTELKNNEEIEQLCLSANNIRKTFCGNKVDLCSIMNAKSGRCSEDCKFCAQSVHYNTNAEIYGLVSKEAALKVAKENESEGVNRFSLVTSGRGITSSDFEKVLDIYEKLNRELKMKLCASLGILEYDKLLKLKERGITMYHHNLETSREFYKEICTTHSYEERIDTIKA